MTAEELEIQKFEHAKQIQLEEIELKRKEFELRIAEQKGKQILTPLVLSIVGGFITILTGVVLKYLDSSANMKLEDKKFQTSLLLKAADAKSYEEFSEMLVTLQENGFLNMDSTQIARIRKKRFVATVVSNNAQKAGLFEPTSATPNEIQPLDPKSSPENLHKPFTVQDSVSSAMTEGATLDNASTWTVVAGADSHLAQAFYELTKSKTRGFDDNSVWYRNKSYRLCIGKYSTYADAASALFDIKEKLNPSSYIVRINTWCPNANWDKTKRIWVCK